jgi:hypothetical protein
MTGESAKDNAWSTEIETAHPADDDDDDRHTDHGGNQHEDEYALLHSTETDEGRHPGRPLSWGEERSGFAKPVMPYADYTVAGGPDALSPGGYEDYRREAGAGTGTGTGTGAKGGAGGSGSGYSFGR